MNRLLELSQRVFTLSQTGITYCRSEYDLERYNELKEISNELIAIASGKNAGEVKQLLSGEHGYITPKVDIRAVVFHEDKILMVKEKSDSCWSLPGGWADWGYPPSAIAEKEAFEEAGVKVKAEQILAVYDKAKHNHPPDFFYIYKIFILCELIENNFQPGVETSDAGYFAQDALPPLSEGRNTREQIDSMFGFLKDGIKPALFD